ncbi:MAG: MarR family transcriptional regulator [Tissierellia bacterium]|nr:MarR family transcriptional regulator [Tissierellia bacterium]
MNSKDELKIFIGMSRVLNEINRKTGKIFSKYNLTNSQFAVLEVLYHKGDLTIGEVKEKILSTSGTIPVIVRNLERDGYLQRKRDKDDKRKYILHITEKGRDLMDKVYPENEKMIISLMDNWDESDKKEIIYYMKKFGGNNEKTN